MIGQAAPGGGWAGLLREAWRRVRGSRLLLPTVAVGLQGLVLLKDGASIWFVLPSVVGGVAGAKALLEVLGIVRVEADRALEDYIAGRSDDDATGAGYQVFRAVDIIGPPIAALLLTAQLASMLPQVPPIWGQMTGVAMAIAMGLGVIRLIVKVIRIKTVHG